MQRPSIALITPDTQAQLDATRMIFTEYAGQPGMHLCLQNFNTELDEMESARALCLDLGFTSVPS